MQATDRDTSDAARSIIEMTAIYANDTQLNEILDELQTSRYKRFRKAAEGWQGRVALLNQLRTRIRGAKREGRPLHEFSVEELEMLAMDVAMKLRTQVTSANSRKLANIIKVIWSKRSQVADSVLK